MLPVSQEDFNFLGRVSLALVNNLQEYGQALATTGWGSSQDRAKQINVWSAAYIQYYIYSLSPALCSNKLKKSPSCFNGFMSPDPKVYVGYLLRSGVATASFAKKGKSCPPSVREEENTVSPLFLDKQACAVIQALKLYI